MNYLDAYYSRINHLGTTTAERIRNGGIRSFIKWMSESPHTVRHLSVQRGIYFDGIILTNKDKQHQKIMFLNVSNQIPINVGDIMNWKLDNGQIQKWILVQEEKKVNGTYRTFWIVRCNYLMKWVDGDGHVQQSWSYFVSSLDSKIKGNFRTWNSLITPQPNKYAQILMPRYPINRATNFIVEEESWTVVQYDHTSVPGIIYLSLTEGKINSIYDDVQNNLADTNNIASYEIITSQEPQVFQIGQFVIPSFTLMKNGQVYSGEYQFIPDDKSIITIENDKLKALRQGTTTITVQLKDFPSIKNTITVKVGAPTEEFFGHIQGNNSIRLNRTAIYKLVGKPAIDENSIVTFSLENTALAKFVSIQTKDNVSTEQIKHACKIQANDENQLGDITLIAEYNGNTYTKVISIIPLW